MVVRDFLTNREHAHMRLIALSFMLLTAAAPLFAQTPLRTEDTVRLERYAQTAGNALMTAFAQGAPQDVAALATALSGTPQVAFDQSLQGDWNCRTLKLGGITSLTVYTNFKCRFTIKQDGFEFEKLSGSQRTKGHISFRDGRAVYVGMGYVADEVAPLYSDLPADFASGGRIQTNVAIFERVSDTRARLLFPSPAVESDFDILELTR
jgi:hypothetical protein